MALRVPKKDKDIVRDKILDEIDPKTNFVLKPITLEDLDKLVFDTFNNRFTINEKTINLINLDSDLVSMEYENPQQFDKDKGYLNLPYFTVWRKSTKKLTRTSSSNKSVIYSIPKSKGNQGIVYEEYICPPPVFLELEYDFQFITTFRQSTNDFEQAMLEVFRNKRISLVLYGERFELSPIDPEVLGSLEVVDREGSNGQSLYVLSYNFKLWAYTRDLKDLQKRERINTFSLKIVEKNNGQVEQDIESTIIKDNP